MSHSPAEPAVLAPRHNKSLADTPLRKFFEAAVKFEASDIILRSEQAPKLRLRGDLKSLDIPPINPDDMEKELHYYAKKLLDEGKVQEAWQVLLAG